jgi:hypothetical protein
MAKPILLLKTSSTMSLQLIERVSDELEIKFNDYHILVLKSNLDEPTFEVLNGEDLDPVTIEELKAKLNL